MLKRLQQQIHLLNINISPWIQKYFILPASKSVLFKVWNFSKKGIFRILHSKWLKMYEWTFLLIINWLPWKKVNWLLHFLKFHLKIMFSMARYKKHSMFYAYGFKIIWNVQPTFQILFFFWQINPLLFKGTEEQMFHKKS